MGGLRRRQWSAVVFGIGCFMLAAAVVNPFPEGFLGPLLLPVSSGLLLAAAWVILAMAFTPDSGPGGVFAAIVRQLWRPSSKGVTAPGMFTGGMVIVALAAGGVFAFGGATARGPFLLSALIIAFAWVLYWVRGDEPL